MCMYHQHRCTKTRMQSVCFLWKKIGCIFHVAQFFEILESTSSTNHPDATLDIHPGGHTVISREGGSVCQIGGPQTHISWGFFHRIYNIGSIFHCYVTLYIQIPCKDRCLNTQTHISWGERFLRVPSTPKYSRSVWLDDGTPGCLGESCVPKSSSALEGCDARSTLRMSQEVSKWVLTYLYMGYIGVN